MARNKGIPNASIERLLRSKGAKRVSKDAIAAMRHVIEDHAGRIATQAAEIASTSRRKTVQGKDIKVAASR